MHITSWHPDDMMRRALHLDAARRKRHVVGAWLSAPREKERTRKPSAKVAAARAKSNLRRKKACVGGVSRGVQSDAGRQIRDDEVFTSIVARFPITSYFLTPHLVSPPETIMFFYFVFSFFFRLPSPRNKPRSQCNHPSSERRCCIEEQRGRK